VTIHLGLPPREHFWNTIKHGRFVVICRSSEADGSVAAPEFASVAEVSEASAKVIQTSSLPFIIPTHISPSSESDLDDIPIGQRMRKLHKPSPQP